MTGGRKLIDVDLEMKSNVEQYNFYCQEYSSVTGKEVTAVQNINTDKSNCNKNDLNLLIYFVLLEIYVNVKT